MTTQRGEWGRHERVVRALDLIIAMVRAHREALAAYESTDDGIRPPDFWSGDAADGSSRAVSDVLRRDYAALAYVAQGYAVLFELALRSYEPEWRRLAPARLAECTESLAALSDVILDAVAEESFDDGSPCRCICPMCGIGACGCVAVSTATWRDACQRAYVPREGPRGFLIPSPRHGSPLAAAGVRRGDRLLEIDGQPVTSVLDVQTALRRHALGDEVALVMRSGPLTVLHVSDYPEASTT